MRWHVLGGLLLAVSLSGCLEDDIHVHLQPDGQGSFQLERTLSADLSVMARDGFPEEVVAGQLANFDGVVAWTDVRHEMLDGDRLKITATGWFTDLNEVTLGGESDFTSGFVLEQDGAHVVVRPKLKIGDDPDGFFDESSEEIQAQTAEMERELLTQLEGFRQDVTFHCPAPVRASGDEWAEVTDTTARHRMDAEFMLRFLRGLVEAGEELRPDFESGAINEAQANQALASAMHRLATGPEVSFGVATVQGDFGRDLAAAIEDYEGSPWKDMIETSGSGDWAPPPSEPDVDPPADLAVGDDPYEPNQDRDSASPIAAGVHRNLQLNEQDWYAVKVSANQSLRVLLEFDHEAGDVDCNMQDDDWNQLGSSTGVGNTEVMRYVTSQDVTIYINVYGYGGTQPYHMTVALEEFVPADEFEPNDAFAQAAAMGPGAHQVVRSGDDHYRVTVPEGHEAVVELTFRHSQGDIDVQVQDIEENYLDSSGGVSDREEVRFGDGVGGDYVLRVYGGNEEQAYTVNVRLVEYVPADRFEPNDHLEQARDLEPGTYEDLVATQEDWYSVHVPDGQQVRVQIDFNNREADLELAIVDEYGSWLDSSTSSSNQEVVTYGRGTAQQVWIQIYNGQRNPYSMTISLEEWAPADEYEPNDTREDAKPIQPGNHAGLVCTGEDYYTIQLKGGETLTVNLAFSHDNGDIDLEVGGPAGWAIESSTGITDTESVSVTAEQDGEYYIHVYLGRDNGYSMEIQVR
jgi:Bacterial pre-peptidase C-terminal domain